MSATATAEPTVGVREGTRDDLPVLAAGLARSFDTCPAWQWYLPPEMPGRLERMERFFAFFLGRFYLAGGVNGRTCLTTADAEGVALVDPPNGWKLGTGGDLRMLAAMVPVFRRGLGRAVRGFGALDSNHPDEPHYYLSVLGVDPEADRRGIAGALLDPVLERCDSERAPAYLETGRPKSRDFFVRHGFEVTERFELPGGGPPVWRLWREPGS